MDDTTVAKSEAHEHENQTENWLNNYLSTLSDPSNNDQNHEGIAVRLYSLCLWGLRQIYRQEEVNSSIEKRTSALKEELGKFYLWGEALGGGRLDKAIEYSDDVRCDVLDSLGEVARLLGKALRSSPLDHQPEGSQDPTHELNYLLEQSKAITSSKINIGGKGASGEDNGSGTDQDDESEDDEKDDIVEELGLHTRWLTQLAPTLEQNWMRAQSAPVHFLRPPFSVSGPAEIYVSLVREKYKYAQNQLVERLGEANWQRHLKVRKRMEASGSSSQEAPQVVEELPEAKSVFRPYSAFHDSGIGTSVPAPTEYAPSHTSFQSSNSESHGGVVRVPTTPAEVYDGKPFQCFLCKRILSDIKTRVDWKIHMFSDLRPYICTFSDCEAALAQFDRRAAWAEHEFTQHRNLPSWVCPECPQKFSDVSDWDLYLQQCHNLTFAGSHLQIARAMALKSYDWLIEEQKCPLCRAVVGKPRRGFVKHVGRHMEEIALMALPRDVDEDPGEVSASSDHELSVSEAYDRDIWTQSDVKRFHNSDDNISNYSSRRSLRAKQDRKMIDRNGRTRLARACHNGSAEVEQLIRKYPQDTDRLDNVGMTPLQIASLAGHLKAVQLLVDAGCDVNSRNIDFDTPLIFAVEESHLEVVKLLLQAGADPRTRNSKGQEPIELINANDKDSEEIKAVLIHAIKGSNVRQRTRGRNTRTFATESDVERPSTPEKSSQKTGPPDYTFTDDRFLSAQPFDLDIKVDLGPKPKNGSSFDKIEFQHSFSEKSNEIDTKPELVATSYWSVSEKKDFINHVSSFGTDWQKIAQIMQTKTAQMLKNHYTREIDPKRGERARELVIAANLANEKISNESMKAPLPPTLRTQRSVDQASQQERKSLRSDEVALQNAAQRQNSPEPPLERQSLRSIGRDPLTTGDEPGGLASP